MVLWASGIAQRQEGQWAGRQKDLLRAALMGQFMSYRGDDGGVMIGPLPASDIGLLAQWRVFAFACHQALGNQHAAIFSLHLNPCVILMPRTDPIRQAQVDTVQFVDTPPKGLNKSRVFDDMTELRLLNCVGIKVNLALTQAIPNMHRIIGR